MNIIQAIASSLILIASLIGSPSQASQPASQPVTEAPTFDARPLHMASIWGPEALSEAGIQVKDNVTIIYTNEDNCGAMASKVQMGGCTIPLEDGGYIVTVSPELAYTAWGNHVLFHEIAHTMGANECEAEAYAHQFEDPANLLWAYPECGTEDES